MFKRAFLPLVLAALVLPAAAAAKVYDVNGAHLGLLGQGDVKVELTASANAKPVRIAQVGGTLEITALSDDVQIKCKSRGAAKGETSTSCTGKAVLATVTGSHFSIHASGKHYALGIPAGYTGSVDAANAVLCGKAAGGVDCRALVQKLRQGRHGGSKGSSNGGDAGSKDSGSGTSSAGTNDSGAEPGTDASLAELAAALAALGK